MDNKFAREATGGWARRHGGQLGTVLCVLGALLVLGTAGAADMQDAAGLPVMSTLGFLGRMAAAVALIASGYLARRASLTPRKSAAEKTERRKRRIMEGRA